MINIESVPVSGTFNLAGKYEWGGNEIRFNVTLYWDADSLNNPVVQKITWLDPIPETKRGLAETFIQKEIESIPRSISVIYR